MLSCATCVTLAVVAATPPADAAAPSVAPAAPDGGAVAGLLARVDEAWRERDVPERLTAAKEALERAAALAPDDYRVLWRQARLDVWRSDDGATDARERSRIGKHAWETAERAIKKGPARVEGYLYAALGMGNYALSLGVIRALREGIEEKFRSRLRYAEAIDRTYLDGTVYVAWGRFWYELPWPKYDARKSEEALRKALAVNPANLRARLYLAELYVKEGKRDEARRLLQETLDARPGTYDAPEERRVQARAREILTRLE